MRKSVLLFVALHFLIGTAACLWLLWCFVPVSGPLKTLITLVGIAAVGIYAWKRYRHYRHQVEGGVSDLPHLDTQAPVVLVCGDSLEVLFQQAQMRKTAQGWWLRVGNISELASLVDDFVEQQPRQVGQLSVMYVCQPGQHEDNAVLRESLRALRHQMAQISKATGFTLPLSICIIAIIGFSLYAFDDELATSLGIGPFNGLQIFAGCAVLAVVLVLLGWLIEKLCIMAGRSNFYLNWKANRQQSAQAQGEIFHEEEAAGESGLDLEAIRDHLRLRYGRFWARKVKILLVLGSKTETEKAAPGLVKARWQESEGDLLVYGDDAGLPPDDAFLTSLKQLRSRRPVDGIVQVVNTSAFPTDADRDAFLRYRQKADALLGWQAPVWLWFTQETEWTQAGRENPAAGAIFGPGAQPAEARASLKALFPRLSRAGVHQLLSNTCHDWLLRLSSQLQDDKKKDLKALLSGLMQGPAAYRLRGVMFSPEQTAVSTVPHGRKDSPTWAAIIDDSRNVSAKKITFDWLQMLRLLLLAAAIVWAAGTLLSLTVNRTQIYQAQETARLAADTTYPAAWKRCCHRTAAGRRPRVKQRQRPHRRSARLNQGATCSRKPGISRSGWENSRTAGWRRIV